jgi:ADP-L-glycero-D-manno-heptose 6-epimerase
MAYLHQQGHDVEGWEWDPKDFPDVRPYDWVVHLGAIADMTETDVDKVLQQNLEFSQQLFNDCNKHGVHLQYASSSSVYGNTKDTSEYAPCYPQTPYAWSKYLFDRWVFNQKPTIMVQGFRYFNVYGKWMHLRGSRANAIYKWRQEARKEGKITVWENAEHVYRDWTWVGDICRLQTDFMTTVNGSGIWNVGTGSPTSFEAVAKEIAKKYNAEIDYIPMPDDIKNQYQKYTCADLTNLRKHYP